MQAYWFTICARYRPGYRVDQGVAGMVAEKPKKDDKAPAMPLGGMDDF